MLMRMLLAVVVFSLTLPCGKINAQNPAQAGVPQSPAPLVPATRLEAFKPAAGTLVTIAYNELGGVSGVSVDVREMRGAQGARVRGMVVEVRQSQYREERAFVDADELDELLRGIDALLAVQSNPTTFQNFEVRYTTKGELRLTAFNTNGGAINYAVQAGRVGTAQVFLNQGDMQRLRALFATAREQLSTASGAN
jgi:hypothetical protein